MAMTVAMLVNRAGASMVFFDVVGRFQANRLIADSRAAMTVFSALMLDTLGNVRDTMQDFSDTLNNAVDSFMPMTEAMMDAEIELSKFLQHEEDFAALREQVIEIGEGFGYTGDQALLAAAKNGTTRICSRKRTNRDRSAIRL